MQTSRLKHKVFRNYRSGRPNKDDSEACSLQRLACVSSAIVRVVVVGVGRAAGWIYPISTLMEQDQMDIVECNVPVKSAAAFFSGMCAPDALARYYNPFGEYFTSDGQNHNTHSLPLLRILLVMGN